MIVILGILAGITVLAFGRGSDNPKATAIMADLDAVKNALLAYSMEYRTRNVDPLVSFVGAEPNNIKTSLDKYVDGNLDLGRLQVRRDDGGLSVGFENLTITSGIKNALDKKIGASGGAYTGGGNATSYSVWLPIR